MLIDSGLLDAATTALLEMDVLSIERPPRGEVVGGDFESPETTDSVPMGGPFFISPSFTTSRIHPGMYETILRSSEKPETFPTEPEQLTDKDRLGYQKAADHIFAQNNERIHISRRAMGEREAQYFDLIKNDKNRSMTVQELLDSDIPLPLDSLGWDRINQLIERGHKDIRKQETGEMTVHCATCRLILPQRYLFAMMGRIYCSKHVPSYEMCGVCSYLQKDPQAVHTFDDRDIFVCSRCVERRAGCNSCGERLPIEYVEAGECGTCIDGRGSHSHNRTFSRSLKWVSKELGQILRTPRMVSAEIEGFVPSGDHLVVLAGKYPKEGGMGRDGSLEGKGHPFEIQTPRIAGAKGEEFMHRAAAALKSVKASVNSSCGMHIHLDGKGIIPKSRKEYPAALMHLWRAHLVFEDVILSFLPYERRNNPYCRPMAQTFTLTELDGVESLLDAEKLWYRNRSYNEIRESKRHHRHSSRYFGVNLHSLLANGHMEIRYHSGTLLSKKVLEWANLHALIMDASVKGAFKHDFLQEAMATSSLREKAEMLFSAIGLAESSRQYFYRRQKKFAVKRHKEADTDDKQPEPQPAAGIRTARAASLTELTS